MTSEQMQELIDTLLNMGETMATEAFRLAMRQVMVIAITNTVWSIVAIIAAIGSYKLARYGQEKSNEDRLSIWDLGAPTVAAGGLFAILIAAIMLNDAIVRFINPEWYAIELVLGLIK